VERPEEPTNESRQLVRPDSLVVVVGCMGVERPLAEEPTNESTESSGLVGSGDRLHGGGDSGETRRTYQRVIGTRW
jgi:hypothetical protein